MSKYQLYYEQTKTNKQNKREEEKSVRSINGVHAGGNKIKQMLCEGKKTRNQSNEITKMKQQKKNMKSFRLKRFIAEKTKKKSFPYVNRLSAAY